MALSEVRDSEARFIDAWVRGNLVGFHVSDGLLDGRRGVSISVMRPDDCGDGSALIEVYASVDYRQKARRKKAAIAAAHALEGIAATNRYRDWTVYEPFDGDTFSTVLAMGRRHIEKNESDTDREN